MKLFHRSHSIQGSLLLHELSFVLLILVTAVVALGWGFAWQKSAAESLRLTAMNSHTQSVRSEVYRQLKEVFDATFLGDKYASDEYAHYLERINSYLVDLDSLALSPREQAAIAKISQAYDGFHLQTQQLLAEQNLNAQHMQLLDRQLEQYTFPELEVAFIRFEELLSHKQQLLTMSRESWLRQMLLLVVLPVIIAFTFLLLARRFVRRNMVKPLSEVMQGAKWISSGDFSHQIPEAGLDELNNLARAINSMATELAKQHEGLALSSQLDDNHRVDTDSLS
jgi:nitrate/nitrite-specific signal transduction histidine kinase